MLVKAGCFDAFLMSLCLTEEYLFMGAYPEYFLLSEFAVFSLLVRRVTEVARNL